MVGRILPYGLEFKPFDYHGYIIHLDEFGDWNVYHNKKHMSKFPHCINAMDFINGRE